MPLARRVFFVLLTVVAACGDLKSGPIADDSGAPDADAEVPDVPDDAMVESGSADAEVEAGAIHFVFVTTAQVAGDFGGSVGDPQLSADSTCQGEATTVGALTGKYLAWLSYQDGSSTAHNARDRVPNVAYYLPGDRLDGGAPIMIAASLADLLSNGPSQPLDRLANGTQVPSDENPAVAWVWTGTKADGTVDLATCSSWRTALATEFGLTGNAREIPDHSAADWTNLNGRTCDVRRRFYCFQQ